MNKTVFSFILSTALFAAVLTSCEKKEDSSKSSGAQRNALVSTLNKHDDLSKFVALLKELYVDDIKVEGFTVFAVTNEGMDKSIEEGINLKRHMVASKYLKSSLTNGQQIVALDGTVLKIITMGGRVYVNGVELGDEIHASNSVAYIVEKPITVAFNTAQYSFSVYECNAAWSPNNNVPYLAVSGAVINLRDSQGRELDTHTTDTNGNLTITLVDGKYFYKVTKGTASIISKDGFIIAGMFTSQEEILNSPFQTSAVVGGLKFADLNWDGRINDDDKPWTWNEPWLPPPPPYGFIWLQTSQVVYIAAADFAPTYKP